MRIADISVQRPVGVIIIVLAVMIIGFVSLAGLTIDLLPDINLPVAAVLTDFQGAAPQEIENLITRPLEGSLSTVQGLDEIRSISAPNQSVILLFYDFGTNMDVAMLDVRDRVDLVREFLPDEAGQPLIIKFDPNALPIMQLSLSGNVPLERLTSIADDTIAPSLERIPGVAQVSITGSETRQINIAVDPAMLETYQLTFAQLIQVLNAENINASAGTVTQGSQDLSLRITGEFESVEDIRQVNVATPTGDMVRLDELASIEDQLRPPSSLAYINGQPTLSLDITKQSDANTVNVARAVNAEIESLSATFSQNVQLDTILDSSVFILQAIQNVVINMLIGGAMATLVLLLFLRSVRSTLIIFLSIPIAIISAFTLIYFSGETLNILTMGGLALGIGLMVDSSIVILENIFKFREQGYSTMEAAKKGAAEIGAPVIAGTLTSVVVFLPIVFTSGLASIIFMPLALTVTFTLIASLFVALTLVPMLASRLLPARNPERYKSRWQRISTAFGNQFEALNGRYLHILKWSISHKLSIIIITIVLLAGSLLLIPLVGTEFLPEFDQGEILVNVEMPPGTSLNKTATVIQDLEQYLLGIDEVDIIFSAVGGDTVGFDTRESTDRGSIYTLLVPKSDRQQSTNDVIRSLEEYSMTIPDAYVQVSALQSADVGESPLSLDVLGDDLAVIESLATEVQQSIEDVAGLRNIENSLDDTRQEVRVVVDRDEAAAYGLSYAQIMQTIQISFQGQTATFIRLDGQEIEVRIGLPADLSSDIADLEQLNIQTQTGDVVPLGAVANFIDTEGPQVISRQNQQRGINISADLSGRDLGSVISDVRQALEPINVPDGYMVRIGGQFEQMTEAFTDLTLALILAVFLVYAVMAVQFEKAMYPFIVMFSLPATMIGVILGFVITGRPLSAPAFIGFIILAGIVVNNAIVLIDYVNTLRDRGYTREEALLEAGPARLRPILMTMLTTVLAMIPLALGYGEGAEVQAPLATVIVFGLSSSTLVTLVLVPVMYIYMDQLSQWIKGVFQFKSEQ